MSRNLFRNFFLHSRWRRKIFGDSEPSCVKEPQTAPGPVKGLAGGGKRGGLGVGWWGEGGGQGWLGVASAAADLDVRL